MREGALYDSIFSVADDVATPRRRANKNGQDLQNKHHTVKSVDGGGGGRGG